MYKGSFLEYLVSHFLENRYLMANKKKSKNVLTSIFLACWPWIRGCLQVKFHLELNLHVLARIKFHPRMISSASKDRNGISSQDQNKERRMFKHLSGWNFTMSLLLIKFWRMYSNMISNVNMFGHNES